MPGSRRITGRAWALWLVALVLVAAAVGLAIYLGPRVGGPAAETGELWTCPMHPSVVRPEPGNCPICGMKLVPLEEEKETQEQGIAGHGVVQIDPKKQQLIGVVTTPVERRRLERVVRTVGRVTVDESRLSEVHTKVEGWVEKLYASETGKLVRKGQPLLTIYSPELVSTQQEYLVALRSRDRLAKSPFPEVKESGRSLLAAARERLRLWDISEQDIARLEETGEVRKTLTLHAPASGYVMETMVVEGMRVMPAMTLYRLADLSRVWVEADIYEAEAPVVKVGQRARLTLQSQPGRVLEGVVTYIYPVVAATTRTLTARLEFANPGLALKPEMYADVEIAAAAGEALAIPQQAVLDSGTRKVVFVQVDEGTFVPREVVLGPYGSGFYPVLEGLKEGEKVVSSPNFLIDSESRLQAALEAAKSAAPAPPGHAH